MEKLKDKDAEKENTKRSFIIRIVDWLFCGVRHACAVGMLYAGAAILIIATCIIGMGSSMAVH